jgi:hypothetical protein
MTGGRLSKMEALLRYWFAGLAMHAILYRNGGYDNYSGLIGVSPEDLTYESFKYANSMVEASIGRREENK